MIVREMFAHDSFWIERVDTIFERGREILKEKQKKRGKKNQA